ncbi:anti-sigma factor [Maribacter sp.]|nr:anti-sigma factor [Maribacter sp.]
MDVEKYIASGVLELYLTGTLSEEENFEVYQNALKHPKIKEEIWSIEAAIFELSKSVFPEISRKKGFTDLKDRIGESEAEQLPKKRFNWRPYASSALIVLFALGLIWSVSEVSQLTSDLNTIDQQNQVLHSQIAELSDSLVKSNELVALIKSENTLIIPLSGQPLSSTANAKLYWNKEEGKITIDAQGLPAPPDGFVYQVWSLKSDSFSLSSVGALDNFLATKNKFFVLNSPNVHETETFGISLAPVAGGVTPTAEQFVVLGSISPSS